MYSPFVHEILNEWKAESKVTHLMLFKLRDGELTIFTDRPGPLIGRGGQLIAKYEEKLKNLHYGKVQAIKLIETDGIF